MNKSSLILFLLVFISCASIESYPPLNGDKEHDTKIIRSILGSHLNENKMRNCYSHVLKRDSSKSGIAVMDFKINIDGKVSDVSVSTELGEELASCLKRRLLGIKFPPISTLKPITARQPYNFSIND